MSPQRNNVTRGAPLQTLAVAIKNVSFDLPCAYIEHNVLYVCFVDCNQEVDLDRWKKNGMQDATWKGLIKLKLKPNVNIIQLKRVTTGA